ncbi:hypothetical protein LHY28_003355 [Salmonella enterica]|nr:hypothetical protein [Salmonella enterica]EII9336797.1 hypothetical protein [Salmonella enterica]EJI0187685.1 hypothetical protein [Salmonella enterica]
MRYWILVALLNGLFALVIYLAAPEMPGNIVYYIAGVVICSLIALVITWHDVKDMEDKVSTFFKWGILAAGLALFVGGLGYKLEFWGDHTTEPGSDFVAVLPDLVTLAGALILFVAFIRQQRS